MTHQENNELPLQRQRINPNREHFSKFSFLMFSDCVDEKLCLGGRVAMGMVLMGHIWVAGILLQGSPVMGSFKGEEVGGLFHL